MNLDLRRIQALVAVAEAETLSQAADRLSLSQPALSRRIQHFEADLGFSLFEPAGRGIRLTGEGEILLGQCRELVNRIDEIEKRAQQLAKGDSGLLRIGASPQVLERLFPPLLQSYRSRYPNVEIELIEDGQRNLLVRLERGEIHMAVSSFSTDEQFASKHVTSAYVYIATAIDHRLADLDRVEIQDLAGESVLVLHREYMTRLTFDAACRLAHVDPRIVLESGAPHTILALAASGHGVAVVPTTVRVESDDLFVAPLIRDGQPLEMRFTICWNRGHYFAPYARAFLEELEAVTRSELEAG